MSRPAPASNRLALESSPYLLLHAHNPVDWYPWGPEAIERARAEDKPIFLSVGYSTCYWCHVMERESFSDPGVAELMNREFVNVKLDREERPDLDEIYMTATQILTHQGGWPNSVFLTPNLEPFFAGTYFPPVDGHGRPGFRSVLAQLAAAWRERRADVLAQAAELADAMQRYLEHGARPAAAPPGPLGAERAVRSLARRFDVEFGGFGGAPKFPAPANLELLEELAAELPEAATMLARTLDAMARGGIYDQLGGGFHRYATDRAWNVPHFEKMLYDNGLLLELYAREHARTGEAQAARVVRETGEWLAREMTTADGAFASAIDAETAGHEGAFYVWTRGELEAILGAGDTAFMAPLFGFDRPPFFERDRYVLHQPLRFEEVAARRRMPIEELLGEIAPLKAKLFAARAERERPATDDKILADWNGTAIAGLAVAGAVLGESDLIARAARAAEFVLGALRPGGRLVHTYRAGIAKIPAFLSDYAFVVRGLLALERATGEERWLDAARELAAEQSERLGDPDGGFFTAAESSDVRFRAKDLFDGALPAANAVAVDNLLALAARTGEESYRGEANRALRAVAALVSQHPEGARSLAVAARRYWQGAAVGESPLDEPAGPTFEDLADQAESLVEPRFELSEPRVDGWLRFRLVLRIADGWHVQANPASDAALVATAVDAEGAQLQDVRYPEGIEVTLGDRAIAVYQGTIEIVGELLPEPEQARLLLTYQACDDQRCLPPITRVAALG